ncbi:MAG: MlaD family protein [Verrucomicrobiota bacterium]
MNDSKLTTRVGVFVFISLVLCAVLMLVFSKGGSLTKPGYTLLMQTPNVGGIRPGASVMMAGVPIGYVRDSDLMPDGKLVVVTLRIYARYPIRRDAKFSIEQAGFLGDQYVSIEPQSNQGALLIEGDKVGCDAPFNMQETAREAGIVLEKVSQAVEKINGGVSNVSSILLNPAMLATLSNNLSTSMRNIESISANARSNIAVTLTNLSEMSDRARLTVGDLQLLVQGQTNTVALVVSNFNLTSSNLTQFSDNLRNASAGINVLVATNGSNIANVIGNVQTATRQITNSLASLQTDLDEGKGLLGSLLKDEQMKRKTDLLMGNLLDVSANLEVATSNLNRNGIWWMLWKQKLPKTNQTGSNSGRKTTDN